MCLPDTERGRGVGGDEEEVPTSVLDGLEILFPTGFWLLCCFICFDGIL